MFRLKFSRAFVAALAIVSMLTLSPANAAVVRQVELPELVSISDLVVHAIVLESRDDADVDVGEQMSCSTS